MVVVMGMNIDITRLRSGIDEYTNIDLNYSFSKEQLNNTGILYYWHTITTWFIIFCRTN